MEERAIRGVPWTLLTFGTNKIIGFLTTLALARMVSPDDFGLFALAALVSLFLTIFRDLGLGSSLIVRQDFDRRGQGTVVTMMILLGVIAAILVVGVSPLAALAFDEPRLSGVLAAISVTLILGSVAWAYEVLMQRALAFKRRFIAQLIQTLSYTVVAISLGLAGAGVWSLVGGAIAAAAGSSIAYYLLAPYRVPLGLNRGVARDAVTSSRGFIAQGILELVRVNADYLAVGRLLGTEPLGLYGMAYRLGELPTVGIADPVAKVTFPAFSEMGYKGQDVSSPFLASLRLVALITVPVGAILSGAAEPFVDFAFGDKWAGMVGPLTVLGVWAAVRPIEATESWLLNSLGQAGVLARILAAVLVVLIPGFVLAAALGNITVVACVALGELLITLPAIAVVVHRRLGLSLARQWQALRPMVIAAPVTWLASWATATGLEAQLAGVTLAAAVAAGSLTYLETLTLVEPGLLRTTRGQIRRILRRSPPAAAAS